VEPRRLPLTDEERAVYEWQIWVPGFGEAGQERLKAASALVSRCGGLGSPVAYSLAAAGIGRLVIAHGGELKPSDLNRQILMTHDWLGKPRAECAARRLRELNPRLEVEAVTENVSTENVERLVGGVDIVFDCAPLFTERFAMNRECVRQGKPLIEAAMFNLEGQVTTVIPGRTPCLACLYPEDPPAWKRQFPVIGAVPALAAQIAAMEGIKLLAGMQPALAGQLLYYDTGSMTFQKIPVARRPDCPVCGGLKSDEPVGN
jgi:molybdopterin/thiamine biosynthesis adenylyltransferase